MRPHLPRIAVVALLGAFVSAPAIRAAPALAVPALRFSQTMPSDSAVVLAVPATHVALELDLQIEADTWLERFDGLLAAQQSLAEAVRGEGVALHVTRAVGMRPEYAKSSLSFSSGAPRNYQPEASLHLLVPLTPDADPLAAMRRLHVALGKAKFAKNVRLAARGFSLALENPEAYRGAVLQKISERLGDDSAALGAASGVFAKITLGGIDGPLRLHQLDDRSIGLSLPFSATFSGR